MLTDNLPAAKIFIYQNTEVHIPRSRGLNLEAGEYIFQMRQPVMLIRFYNWHLPAAFGKESVNTGGQAL